MLTAAPAGSMSPGDYLQRRRIAAGLRLGDVAERVGTDPTWKRHERVEWLMLIEDDGTPITADIVTALARAFRFDRHVLIQLVAIHAGGEIDPPAVCRHCACSWRDACVDSSARGTCGLSADDATLCTACAVPDAVIAAMRSTTA